jgi:hypothetical protein
MKSKKLYRLYRIILKHYHSGNILDHSTEIFLGKWTTISDPYLKEDIRTINFSSNEKDKNRYYYTTAYGEDSNIIYHTKDRKYKLPMPEHCKTFLLTHELIFRKVVVDRIL